LGGQEADRAASKLLLKAAVDPTPKNIEAAVLAMQAEGVSQKLVTPSIPLLRRLSQVGPEKAEERAGRQFQADTAQMNMQQEALAAVDPKTGMTRANIPLDTLLGPQRQAAQDITPTKPDIKIPTKPPTTSKGPVMRSQPNAVGGTDIVVFSPDGLRVIGRHPGAAIPDKGGDELGAAGKLATTLFNQKNYSASVIAFKKANQHELANLAQSVGDNVREEERIRNSKESTFFNKMPAGAREDVVKGRVFLHHLSRLDGMIDDPDIDIGIIPGSLEELRQFATGGGNLKFRRFHVTLLSAMDILIRNRTGAALTISEEAFYKRLMGSVRTTKEAIKVNLDVMRTVISDEITENFTSAGFTGQARLPGANPNLPQWDPSTGWR
jgi:hypothetical protein